MEKIIFFDNQFILASSDIQESLSLERIRGRGVFETMRVYGGEIFALRLHLQRLRAGLKKIHVLCPVSPAALKRYLYQTIRLNKFKKARVRLTVWHEKGKNHVTIIAASYQPYSASQYKKGFKACLSAAPFRFRRGYEEVKSIRYAAFLSAYQKAVRRGYDEVLLRNNKNEIIEGSRTNIFLVEGHTIWTPSLKNGGLNGVTRKTIFKMAKKINVKIQETRFG